MTLDETFTALGVWERSCSHVVDESTAGPVEQYRLDGASEHSVVARCMRCGEWVTLRALQAGLL